jgi:single-strand DNA-binding protein
MLNHITIMGRLTRDPELRRTGSGVAVASFTIAVDRDYNPQGQEKETDFIDCVAWRQTGEFVSKYFTKGRMIVVSGRLQIRSWTDKDGNKRRTAEVVADNCYFGDSNKESGNSQGGYNNPGNNSNYGQQNNGYGTGGQYGGYGGYAAPTAPAGDFAMLEDDGAELPF